MAKKVAKKTKSECTDILLIQSETGEIIETLHINDFLANPQAYFQEGKIAIRKSCLPILQAIEKTTDSWHFSNEKHRRLASISLSLMDYLSLDTRKACTATDQILFPLVQNLETRKIANNTTSCIVIHTCGVHVAILGTGSIFVIKHDTRKIPVLKSITSGKSSNITISPTRRPGSLERPFLAKDLYRFRVGILLANNLKMGKNNSFITAEINGYTVKIASLHNGEWDFDIYQDILLDYINKDFSLTFT